MSQNFIHLLSSQAGIISINGNVIGNIDNISTFELDLLCNKDVFVRYDPVSEKETFMSYTFRLDNKKKPRANSRYVEVVPFPDNHFDVIMNPLNFEPVTVAKTILNETAGKFFVSISNDNISRVNIFSGNTMIYNFNAPKLISAKCYIKKEFLIIEGIISSDEYYLIILNIESLKVIYNDIVHSIEETADYIQALKKVKNIARHAKVCKVDFTANSSEEFYVFEREKAKQPTSPKLLPLGFLEAIKVGDSKTAKSYLSENFANAELVQFQNYFGDFDKVYFNRHSNKQNVFNYTIFNKNYKNYNFHITNGKINEIEEIF